uniref:Uncharacterized protein n=1 Tax=Panagrellus redivivus TaxID=6233 RepID=A0A7E4V777_PANRE
MVALSYNRIRSRVAESVRRFMSPSSSPSTSPLGQTPRSGPQTSRSLFFWPHSKRNSNNSPTHSARTLDAATPDSSRSVSFEDAITWPYIDDDE